MPSGSEIQESGPLARRRGAYGARHCPVALPGIGRGGHRRSGRLGMVVRYARRRHGAWEQAPGKVAEYRARAYRQALGPSQRPLRDPGGRRRVRWSPYRVLRRNKKVKKRTPIIIWGFSPCSCLSGVPPPGRVDETKRKKKIGDKPLRNDKGRGVHAKVPPGLKARRYQMGSAAASGPLQGPQKDPQPNLCLLYTSPSPRD